MIKKRHSTLLIFCVASLTGISFADAASKVSLSEAWKKAQQKSSVIQTQRQTQEVALLKSHTAKWWDDPAVEFSSGSREMVATSRSSVQTMTLRQRLPTGADRAHEKILTQGVAEAESLRTQEVEKEQESKFVKAIYGYRISQVELEHANERLTRITAIQNHLKKTQAYTPSNSLERTLVELRIKQILQRKAVVEVQLSQYRNEVSDLGINPDEVQAPWIPSSSLEKAAIAEGAKGLNEKQMTALVKSKKSQAEVSVWRPQVDVFVSSSREAGGSEEKNQLLGVGLTLPLFSGLSPKRESFEKLALEADLQMQTVQRKNQLQIKELQHSSEMLSKRLKEITEKDIHKLEASTPSFEQALKRGQITIIQFLDYEDQVHQHIEMYYETQMSVVDVLSKMSLYQEKSLIDLLGVES